MVLSPNNGEMDPVVFAISPFFSRDGGPHRLHIITRQVNLCSYSANTDNAEELEKYLGHLRKVAPDNAVCKKLTHLETSIANFVA